MTLTIKAIETTPFSLPLHGSLRWGKSSRLDALEHVLVRVQLSDGSEGTAESPPRPTIYGETVASVVAVIREELLPRLKNTPALPLDVWQTMAAIKNNPTAKGAIDMALHDALAKSAGKELVDHLSTWSGLAVQERIRVSYILGLGEVEALVKEAQGVFDLGVHVLKVKVSSSKQDLGKVEALRTHFGDTMDLYVDANETFTRLDALLSLERFRQLGVLFCEEPIAIERLTERSELRKVSPVPLIADDSCFTLRDLERELELNTFDVLNIKTARTGYTESLQMLTRARAAGKRIMVGSQAGSVLGASRAAAFAALEGIDCPAEVSFHLKLKEDLAAPLAFEDGFLDVSTLSSRPS